MLVKTIRSAILSPALRAVKAETSSLPAEDGAYEYAYEEYINMLSSWAFLENLQLVQFPPTDLNSPVGNADPNYELWNCLVPRIAEYFNHMVTRNQAIEASGAKRRLRNRSSKQAIMNQPKNQPRGSGNRYYNYHHGKAGCCDE